MADYTHVWNMQCGLHGL